MASKVSATTALLLSLNLLFFTLVSGTSYVPCPPPPIKPPPIKPPPIKPPPSCQTCPPVYPSCPRDTLKLGVCANVLNLLKLNLGSPPKYPCCSLLEGLTDLEAAVCLCTAIKANILGINLNILLDLTLLVNYCGKTVPNGFKCA
uniref:Proline-rich protein DC2.15 n=1 Tax=Anthurium amnicola TaxID=1678845 RepID=A0A1D1XKA8_9ARAE